MKHRDIRRGAICFLLIVLLSEFPTTVFAAAKTVTPITGVSVTDSLGTGSLSGTTVTITATGSWGNQKTNTITITNTSSSTAEISFDYSISNQDSYSFPSTSGTESHILASGGTLTYSFQSKSTSIAGAATLTLKNFTYTTVSDSAKVTVTYDSTKGSVALGGSAIANGGSASASSGTLAAVATPASGCAFLGWVNPDTHELLSSAASATLNVPQNMNVHAVFVNSTSDIAWFMVDNKYLTYNLTTAGSLGAKIVLINNGELSGTHTVVSGDTLLIPYDSGHTMYTNCDAYSSETMTIPTAYLTLTMASEAKIVVNGTMNVAGRFAYTNAGGQNGSPSGPLGFVDMESGSNITVNSGGSLYAYGYVIGSGTVTVNSGAAVYEVLQMPEYRGGDQSTGMSNKVFPLSQFYVQNIEVPMTLYAGATENTFGKLLASGIYFDTGITLFGSDGMFELSSGYVIKWYDGSTDRLNIQISGVVETNSIELRLQGLGLSPTVNSKDYVLPINGGFTIHLKSGSSLTIPSTQKISLQPGAQVIIDEGATVTVNSALYVYDAAQWGAYCWYGHSGATANNSYDTPVMPVAYSPTRTYIRPTIFPDAATYPLPTTQTQYQMNFANNITSGGGELNAEKLAALLAALPDASILVNGTLTGNIYTTDGGANIYSTGNGVFTQTATANSTVYQLQQRTTTYVEAVCTPAKLKNANGSYTETEAEATTYYYFQGQWVTTKPTLGNFLTRIKLGDSLNVDFAFSADHFTNGVPTNGMIIQVSKSVAGEKNPVIKQYTYSSNSAENEWSQTTIYGVTYYYITFDDISGKEMADSIKVEIYESDESADALYSYTDSIRDYAMRLLNSGTYGDAVNTMLVDMLYYGAAAQTYYGYGTSDLATVGLTETQKGYASVFAPEEGDATVEAWAEDLADTVGTGSVVVENAYINSVSASTSCSRLELTESFYLHITFNGLKKGMSAKANDIHDLHLASDGLTLYFTTEEIELLSMADARETVIIKVYDGTTLVCTITDSIASYVARVCTGKQTETGLTDATDFANLKALLQRIIMFSDSVTQYVGEWSGK